MKKVIIGGLLLASSVSTLGFPGYVSRDCIALGTKESISVDWKSVNRLFFTESYHKLIVNKNTVTKYLQSTPCAGPHPCYIQWWRNYAGATNLQNTITQLGVNGTHYWWRGNFDSVRYSYANSCNLESWGYDNWDG